MRTTIERWLPAYCIVCQSVAGGPSWLCQTCDNAIVDNQRACLLCSAPQIAGMPCLSCRNHGLAYIDRLMCPFVYTGVMTQLIHKWKFEGASELTPFLVHRALLAEGGTSITHRLPHNNTAPDTGHLPFIARTLSLNHPQWDGLVPIPMGLWRRFQRGYNQSALLAKALSKHLPRSAAIAVHYQLLKDQGGSAQHRLRRRDRSDNSRHRYRAQQSVVGQHLLLIDDVATTGATLSAAAAELRAAGAASVSAWALARTPAPQWQSV